MRLSSLNAAVANPVVQEPLGHPTQAPGLGVTGVQPRRRWLGVEIVGKVTEWSMGGGPDEGSSGSGQIHFRVTLAPRVNALVTWGPGSSTHVLRGRDVRDSLWETGSTLPRPGRIGAVQV